MTTLQTRIEPESMPRHIDEDLRKLIAKLPPHLFEPLKAREDINQLLEVVLDLGREPEARFQNETLLLTTQEVTEEDLQYVIDRISAFGEDNRAGIERTLHRISAIRNRTGKIIGLTLRVGRAVYGTIKSIEDLIFTGKSVLLLGKPGVGKTTLLREVARVLADTAKKRVVVVDTSNEIAGDGNIPHPGIGRARRMQVASPDRQHAVMIEAVENHMPEVIIIDEIGNELDAQAARTIAERGVQLVATAHGNTLDNLLANPTLSDLVGGIQNVTLGDAEARRRRSQKTVQERRAPPTFDILVEIQSWTSMAVHPDVASVVDRILRGIPATPENRHLDEDGEVQRQAGHTLEDANDESADFETEGSVGTKRQTGVPPSKAIHLMPYGVNKGKLRQALNKYNSSIELTGDIEAADAVVTTKNDYRRKQRAFREAEQEGTPVYTIRKNTLPQIQQILQAIVHQQLGNTSQSDPEQRAVQEAEEAVVKLEEGAVTVDLAPRKSHLRHLQHKVAEKHKFASTSKGKEPKRHVVISR